MFGLLCRPFGSALLTHLVATLDQMETGENLEAVAHSSDVRTAFSPYRAFFVQAECASFIVNQRGLWEDHTALCCVAHYCGRFYSK